MKLALAIGLIIVATLVWIYLLYLVVEMTEQEWIEKTVKAYFILSMLVGVTAQMVLTIWLLMK